MGYGLRPYFHTFFYPYLTDLIYSVMCHSMRGHHEETRLPDDLGSARLEDDDTEVVVAALRLGLAGKEKSQTVDVSLV